MVVGRCGANANEAIIDHCHERALMSAKVLAMRPVHQYSYILHLQLLLPIRKKVLANAFYFNLQLLQLMMKQKFYNFDEVILDPFSKVDH